MCQLHCVNLIRQAAFFNWDYYRTRAASFSQVEIAALHFDKDPAAAWTDTPHVIRAHVNHCIDALRERIMCAADTQVSFYKYQDYEGHSMPDFAVTRQCRNFDSVRRWAEERQVIYNGEFELVTPEGVELTEVHDVPN